MGRQYLLFNLRGSKAVSSISTGRAEKTGLRLTQMHVQVSMFSAIIGIGAIIHSPLGDGSQQLITSMGLRRAGRSDRSYSRGGGGRTVP